MTAVPARVDGYVPENPEDLLELLKRSERESATNSLNVVCVGDVEPEEVSWLWPGYLPFGKLTVLEGDPGLGKSTVTLAIAAAVTGGPLLPGMPDLAVADVVLVTYEDGLADTLRPRLDAAGADVTRVHAVTGVSEEKDVERLVEFPSDVSELFDLVRARAAQLVIIDPLSAALSSETDSYKDADVRRVLAPMARLAEMAGCAVVVVRHLTKASSGRAVTAGGGSIGIAAAARAVLAVHQDPDTPDDPSARVLAVVKSNLALRAPSLRFRIVDGENRAARIAWSGESHHSADGLSALRADAGEVSSDREIDNWLRSALDDGALDRKEIVRRAIDAGFSGRSIDRAAHRVGVQRAQTGFGTEKRSMWSLPNRAIPASPANIAMPAGSELAVANAPRADLATIQTNGGIGNNGNHGANDSSIPETQVIDLRGQKVRVTRRLTQHGAFWFTDADEKLGRNLPMIGEAS